MHEFFARPSSLIVRARRDQIRPHSRGDRGTCALGVLFRKEPVGGKNSGESSSEGKIPGMGGDDAVVPCCGDGSTKTLTGN